ncbi:MAG: hypothetical protein K0S28_837 [Paucimonas sp.]|nr:hypothetical protein [Paucimonas sp.]
MQLIQPFQNSEESASIDELTIENGEDRIAIYGSINITRDRQGLEYARQLKSVLDGMLKILNSEKLPEHVQNSPTDETENPFKR